MNNSGKANIPAIMGLVVVLVAVVAGLAWLGNKPSKYGDFAQCLQEKGAKFYGAFWCPHCKDQKSSFGTAQNLLPYVECSTPDRQGQTPACQQEEITNYPTWKFDNGGVVRTGVLSLEELSELSGCQLPA